MTVLRDAYGARARFPIYTRRHLARYTAADLARYRLYGRHWGIGLLAVLPADTVPITLLRDPVERTISWWHHMRLVILHNPAGYAQTRNLWQPVLDQDLVGTLASPFLAGLMTDMQCKGL